MHGVTVNTGGICCAGRGLQSGKKRKNKKQFMHDHSLKIESIARKTPGKIYSFNKHYIMVIEAVYIF